jgi:hypothetical protein
MLYSGHAEWSELVSERLNRESQASFWKQNERKLNGESWNQPNQVTESPNRETMAIDNAAIWITKHDQGRAILQPGAKLSVGQDG